MGIIFAPYAKHSFRTIPHQIYTVPLPISFCIYLFSVATARMTFCTLRGFVPFECLGSVYVFRRIKNESWSLAIIGWEEADSVGFVDGRGGVGHIQLFINVADMRHHRVDADIEFVGNLLL